MTKDEVFALALEAATKSPAKKRKVGAVIASADGDSFTVMSTGYNHNPFTQVCENEHGETLATVRHAEEDAVLGFNKATVGGPLHLFVTHEPCANCIAKFAELLPAGTDVKSRIHVVSSGMKLDDGKMRYDLIPAIATEGLAAVLTYGAKKYKPNNWRSVNPERYVAAFERHWQAYISGEMLDVESGLPHLAHCMTNLAFLLELGYKPERQQTLADYIKNL